MKKSCFMILIIIISFSLCSFSLEGEFLSVWNKAIRKFSGLRNFESGIRIRMNLIDEKGAFFDSEYSLKVWIRDLRDYRIDFYNPIFISDISVVFSYAENLLYVMNKKTKEYSVQFFDAYVESNSQIPTDETTDTGSDITLNPADTLFKTLDFLIGLDQNPFVEMEAYRSEKEGFFNYVLRINQPAGFSLLFIKEYPLLTIEINEDFEINSMIMTNEKTGETFSIFLDELKLNVSHEDMDNAFEITYEDYDLVDYLGKS